MRPVTAKWDLRESNDFLFQNYKSFISLFLTRYKKIKNDENKSGWLIVDLEWNNLNAMNDASTAGSKLFSQCAYCRQLLETWSIHHILYFIESMIWFVASQMLWLQHAIERTKQIHILRSWANETFPPPLAACLWPLHRAGLGIPAGIAGSANFFAKVHPFNKTSG